VRLSKNTTSASKGTPFNVAIVECTVQLRRYNGSAYALHIPKRICKRTSAGAVVKEGLESEFAETMAAGETSALFFLSLFTMAWDMVARAESIRLVVAIVVC
jgi:hypothetical protein